jgi:hypothetical protein
MSNFDITMWPPRDWRAFIALFASILGSVALTFFAAWLVYILSYGSWPVSTAETRIEMLGRALTISLGGSLVVLITLGMAINRRSIKVSSDGFEAIGGDEHDPAPIPVVTTTTTTTSAVPLVPAIPAVETPSIDGEPPCDPEAEPTPAS